MISAIEQGHCYCHCQICWWKLLRVMILIKNLNKKLQKLTNLVRRIDEIIHNINIVDFQCIKDIHL